MATLKIAGFVVGLALLAALLWLIGPNHGKRTYGMKCPDFAAKVWYADGEYYAELAEGGTSHTLRLSGGDLLELIRHRTGDSRLTTAGNKTQHQIDECLPGTDDLVAQFLAKGLQPAKKRSKYTPAERKAAINLLKLVGLK